MIINFYYSRSCLSSQEKFRPGFHQVLGKTAPKHVNGSNGHLIPGRKPTFFHRNEFYYNISWNLLTLSSLKYETTRHKMIEASATATFFRVKISSSLNLKLVKVDILVVDVVQQDLKSCLRIGPVLFAQCSSYTPL